MADERFCHAFVDAIGAGLKLRTDSGTLRFKPALPLPVSPRTRRADNSR